MPTREQKRAAARLKDETRRAITNTIRCGGTPDAIAEEALRQIELRYTLVPRQLADAKCPEHPGITLVRGVCAACGPQDEPED